MRSLIINLVSALVLLAIVALVTVVPIMVGEWALPPTQLTGYHVNEPYGLETKWIVGVATELAALLALVILKMIWPYITDCVGVTLLKYLVRRQLRR